MLCLAFRWYPSSTPTAQAVLNRTNMESCTASALMFHLPVTVPICTRESARAQHGNATALCRSERSEDGTLGLLGQSLFVTCRWLLFARNECSAHVFLGPYVPRLYSALQPHTFQAHGHVHLAHHQRHSSADHEAVLLFGSISTNGGEHTHGKSRSCTICDRTGPPLRLTTNTACPPAGMGFAQICHFAVDPETNTGAAPRPARRAAERLVPPDETRRPGCPAHAWLTAMASCHGHELGE